ncbi:MAG TPA: energy transducer TonB [Candidatus Saccharimonadales bacterium]|nr:energy transducer TonB [Candidatus Saccharimonadales bacterium]
MLLKTAAYALFALLLSGISLPQEQTGRVHENHLRTKAIASVMPKYPNAAKKKSINGVAVAQISVDESGQVTNVEILEAPHPSIGDAVKEALYKWRFAPVTVKGKPWKVRGKMTFYFVKDKKGARVENPYPW